MDLANTGPRDLGPPPADLSFTGNLVPSSCEEARGVAGCCDPLNTVWRCLPDGGRLLGTECPSGCGWDPGRKLYDCLADGGAQAGRDLDGGHVQSCGPPAPGGAVIPGPDGGLPCTTDPSLAPSLGACIPRGAPGYACNPITNEGCDPTKGETCDYDDAAGGFVCRVVQHFAGACSFCGSLFPSCAPGFTCNPALSRCTRYCCNDGDCGAATKCVLQKPSAAGICQAVRGDLLSGFGAAHPPAAVPPACDAPMMPPSGGACVPMGTPCNPVTGGGCPNGQVCDLSLQGFQCYPAPAAALLCQDCGGMKPLCGGGLTCLGKCYRFCCGDADCGTGKCATDNLQPAGQGKVGICVKP